MVINGVHKRIYRRLHRLVYATWVGEIKDTIDHINGNKRDNSVSNLRDVSREYNSKYQPHRTPRTYLITKNNEEFTVTVNFVNELVSLLKISNSVLIKCLYLKETKSYNGNKYKIKEITKDVTTNPDECKGVRVI